MNDSQLTDDPGPKTQRRWSALWPAVVLVAACMAAYVWANRPARSAVAWEADLDAARQKAAAESRPILVEFTADSCAACRMMDRDVFSQQEAAEAMGDFIPVRLEMNSHRAVAQEYGVTGMPTFLVFSPDGRLVTAQVGAVPLRYFLLFLDQARDAVQREQR